ncbi:MAG: chorismate synthase, partial [Lachnospiraceae bacterium]|nr:chorismate synthase [Lachnospiraceae bacterium]
MAGSGFGKLFRITTWGESHGEAIGAVVDGCPAGLSLCEEDIQKYLDERRPGASEFATPRKESDTVRILSGTFEGKTAGSPISMIIYNQNVRSSDYSDLADKYRPGHADYTYDMKYGFRDWRGGGRSSARETAARVAGGAVALKLLEELGIRIDAYTKSIGPVECSPEKTDLEEASRNSLRMPDREAFEKASEYLKELMKDGDSSGGVIECRISGVPAGLGDPVFDKLSADLAKAVFSIGAVKGFEIGDGFAAARAKGSENNDAFIPSDNGAVTLATNHAGGILGGISDGAEIIFRAAFKPTPSISSEQETVDIEGKPVRISIKGRHDPVIV